MSEKCFLALKHIVGVKGHRTHTLYFSFFLYGNSRIIELSFQSWEVRMLVLQLSPPLRVVESHIK